MREDHQQVIKELSEQLAAAKATQSSTKDMLARADKAEQLAEQLQEQLQSSEKTGSDKLAQLAGKLKDIEAKSQAGLAWSSASWLVSLGKQIAMKRCCSLVRLVQS